MTGPRCGLYGPNPHSAARGRRIVVGPIEPTFADALEREESDVVWVAALVFALVGVVAVAVTLSVPLEWALVLAVLFASAIVLGRFVRRWRGRAARRP